MRNISFLSLIFTVAACSPIQKEELTAYVQYTPEEMGIDVLDILVKSPIPRYPSEALEARLEGFCIVQFNISPEGITYNSRRLECSHPIFTSLSLRSASELRFKKPIYQGKSIIIKEVKWKVSFALEK